MVNNWKMTFRVWGVFFDMNLYFEYFFGFRWERYIYEHIETSAYICSVFVSLFV